MGAGLETLKGTSSWRPSAPSRRAATATLATSPPSRSRPRAFGSRALAGRRGSPAQDSMSERIQHSNRIRGEPPNDNAPGPTGSSSARPRSAPPGPSARTRDGTTSRSSSTTRAHLRHRPDLRQPRRWRRRGRRDLLADLGAPQWQAQRRLGLIRAGITPENRSARSHPGGPPGLSSAPRSARLQRLRTTFFPCGPHSSRPSSSRPTRRLSTATRPLGRLRATSQKWHSSHDHRVFVGKAEMTGRRLGPSARTTGRD